jgi:hypothetical protein
MIARRSLLLGVAAAALAGRVRAAGSGGGKPKDILQALGIVVEWWDRDGLFHLVNAELLFVLAKEGIKIGKAPLEKIHKRLASMPWEEFNSGNHAVTIKNVALECARTDEVAGPFVTDVLISKLLIR